MKMIHRDKRVKERRGVQRGDKEDDEDGEQRQKTGKGMKVKGVTRNSATEGEQRM